MNNPPKAMLDDAERAICDFENNTGTNDEDLDRPDSDADDRNHFEYAPRATSRG
ncbi:hypothetical protein [Natrinema hispanicum]|uniref:Uncharacterized protein n=1 Tax=Natrinema hispanicum TaxID=392421 RepID=A0A1G6YGG9_9EURY|nr:hypothetical protein [Natrinema hispanicum]SDD89460.1 hypothetical protein SAMN05192552_10669 [Natrinema hispanicum]